MLVLAWIGFVYITINFILMLEQLITSDKVNVRIISFVSCLIGAPIVLFFIFYLFLGVR
jgi:hypothetical protein